MPYIPHTDAERKAMLEAVGAESLEALVERVLPGEVRLRKPLNLPPPLSELELAALMEELAGRNARLDERPHFLGMGCYDHFVPAVVDYVASRGEFLTAYTPYQPETSQGALQAFYEYQTLVCQLTGMEVANASLYDGATALAEAALLCRAVTGRTRLLVPEALHPNYRQVLDTYLANVPLARETVPWTAAGTLDLEALERHLAEDVAGVVVACPNVFGILEEVAEVVEAAHRVGALAVVVVDPISLGIVRRPGDDGADVVVGEGQSLGSPPSLGGPSLGLFAATERLLRKMPGRLVGRTTDREGRRGFVLTLQTREQHIRRERATSNICTNQGLCALTSLVYLSLLGKEGLARVARLCADKAAYAFDRLRRIPGVSARFPRRWFFNEFVLSLPTVADRVIRNLLRRRIAAGFPLVRYYEGMDNCLLVAVTEKRTKEEIDLFAHTLEVAL